MGLLLALLLLAPPVVRQTSQVTALLYKGGNPYCHATLVSPQLLLTALHCVPNPMAVEWRLRDSSGVGRVVLSRPETDLALVHMGEGVNFPWWASYSKAKPQATEAIWVHMMLPDRSSVLVEGRYVGPMDLREGDLSSETGSVHMLDILGGPGTSGAGVFNEKGELIAVVTKVWYHEAVRASPLARLVIGGLK